MLLEEQKFGFTVDIHCKFKDFACINFSYLLKEDVIRYNLDAFCKCRGCTLNNNILVKENIVNGAQKYLLRGMVNTKQLIVHLGSKYRLNVMVSFVRSCMGVAFDGIDNLQA